MTSTLTPQARALLARPVLASLATIAADGSPQITPLWIDVEGDDLVVNTAQGRAKARNMERNPNVAICVVDPDDPFNIVAVHGTVTEISAEGADAHIDALSKKYMGVDSYPMRQEGEVRLKIRIHPDKIVMQSQE
jgi:PPOX class probable F420-dependent enzyme